MSAAGSMTDLATLLNADANSAVISHVKIVPCIIVLITIAAVGANLGVDALPVSRNSNNKHVGPIVVTADADWFVGDAPSPDHPRDSSTNDTSTSASSQPDTSSSGTVDENSPEPESETVFTPNSAVFF
jgi:hypothetical protein